MTLCDPTDYGPPGSSAHGFFQARILEWVAMLPPDDLTDPGIEPISLIVSCTVRWVLYRYGHLASPSKNESFPHVWACFSSAVHIYTMPNVFLFIFFFFFFKNGTKAETPVLWPPHTKSWLIGKDSDAGRDWGQEEKGTTKDEMAGWHHQLNGREFEWTPGVGDGQGGLACCNSWGRKESDTTERLNWTELNWLKNGTCFKIVFIINQFNPYQLLLTKVITFKFC